MCLLWSRLSDEGRTLFIVGTLQPSNVRRMSLYGDSLRMDIALETGSATASGSGFVMTDWRFTGGGSTTGVDITGGGGAVGMKITSGGSILHTTGLSTNCCGGASSRLGDGIGNVAYLQSSR